MSFQIITAALGSSDAEGLCAANRDDFSSERLELNLNQFWAWNIRGQFPGYDADGPCVFIQFG